MIDHNHITTTDHYKLFVALIGEYYDWDACERQNEGLEADDIIESAAHAGITIGDEVRGALVKLLIAHRVSS